MPITPYNHGEDDPCKLTDVVVPEYMKGDYYVYKILARAINDTYDRPVPEAYLDASDEHMMIALHAVIAEELVTPLENGKLKINRLGRQRWNRIQYDLTKKLSPDKPKKRKVNRFKGTTP